MSQLNRREFVTGVAAAAAGACLACAGDWCLADLAAPAAGGAGKLDVGAEADYAHAGVFDKFAKSDKVLIVREGDKIRALSAICTHKGSPLTVNGQEIVCPKHGSHFTAAGAVTKGPARSPLFHLAISKDDKGHLTVDKSRKLGESELNDPSSFVKVG